ncbi:MAG: peptide deformylase [Synergistaceae bacterium]|nr:peptide deformylase [Synergistaceae bacterium]
MKNLTESEKILSNESSNGILEIRKYPDPVLKKISEPVTVFDDELEDFVKVLFSSMRVHDGVGLAAPQVGVLKKIAVVEYDGKSYVLINPKVVDQKGLQEGEEGCLSFPGIYAHVTRPQWVKIESNDVHGNTVKFEGEGYTARAFLHEMDHLNGKLFIDYLSSLKRNAIKKKAAKHTGGHF